jgi:hypothetical protein
MAAALKKFLRDAKAEEEDSSSDEEQESEWMIECWTLVEPKTDDKGLGDHAKQVLDDRRVTRRQSSDLDMMMMLMMPMLILIFIWAYFYCTVMPVKILKKMVVEFVQSLLSSHRRSVSSVNAPVFILTGDVFLMT